ncbi:MAG: Rv3654c family TadE-like protein [Propioniciclava sp.]
MGRTRGGTVPPSEAGYGTLLVGLAALIALALAGVLISTAVAARQQAAVVGAADLAAVAGGQAQLAGVEACGAARRSAAANAVQLADCRVAGDEVEFVVSVTVTRDVTWGPWGQQLRARAHAGVLTGAPT